MANRIDQAQIKGAAVVNEFNRQFKPNTPCFYQPIRGEDKWYPTRTRSEAWLLGHGEPVVKIDGASGCVCISHLAMPGSDCYEASIAEAEEARSEHANWVPFTDEEAETAQAEQDEQEEQAIYHYAASVNLPQGQIHYDGILVGPMISSMADYMNYRAKIAADVKANVDQVQIHSMSIVGVKGGS